MRCRFFTVILLSLLTFCASAQIAKVDSLRALLRKPGSHDTSLVKIYSLLGEQIYEAQPDTAIWLWEKGINLAEKNLKLNLSTPVKKVFLTEYSAALNNIGFIEQMRGKPNLALYYFKRSLYYSNLLNDHSSIAIAYNNIGYNLVHLGNTSGALDYYNKNLLENIKYGTKEQIIGSLIVMADQYSQMNDYKNAVLYLNKALGMAEPAHLEAKSALIYTQIGNVYKKALKIEEATNSYLKSLRIFARLNDKDGLATCYNNLGADYYALGDYETALSNFKKSLTLRNSLNDPLSTHNTLSNIGLTYLKLSGRDSAFAYLNSAIKLAEKLGNKQLAFESLNKLAIIYFNDKDEKNSVLYATKAFEVARQTGYPAYIKEAADLMRKINIRKKNFQEAYNMYKLYVEMRDSLNNHETEKAGINSRLRYEYDLKTVADSVKISEERKLNEAQLKQEKGQRHALFGGLIIIAIFAGFMYNRFKKTQKQKVIIELKEKETQFQKELLQEKNKEILDSINYAKRLQEAILPSLKIWEKELPGSFVYYEPKDIVAGDFYWIEKCGSKIYFAAADCTGHGVPGALVSVVCCNALNRVVRELLIEQPNQILDKVRELVIETFENSEKEVNDGMDISLCCLDTSTNSLIWAGANNPLWLVRNNILTEIKADKQPIGKHTITKPFTLHQIDLNKGDSIYIFTDGVADQFGGAKGKKFKYKQLEKIIIENSSLPPAAQKDLIARHFKEWKGALEQVDDVCVIGVRV